MGAIDQVTLHISTYKLTPLTGPRTTYNAADNKTRDWESAIRRTRPKGSLVDGVCILAVLDKPDGPEVLLQKQYRPPIDKVCIEMPAGLIDAGESVEFCALRELKEETGYVGKVEKSTGIGPILFNGMFSIHMHEVR